MEVWQLAADPVEKLSLGSLTTDFKSLLWHHLQQAAIVEDVHFRVFPADFDFTATHTIRDITEIWRQHKSTPPDDQEGIPGRPATDTEITSFQVAEQANIRIVCSTVLQLAAVGLYAARTAKFHLSAVQFRTLLRVGATGAQGAYQSHLAAIEGSDNKNFFYVIKNLVQRGLVTKRPAMFKMEQPNNFSTTIQTNIIHLSKFAPERMGRYEKYVPGAGGSAGAGQQTDVSPNSAAAMAAFAARFNPVLATADDGVHFVRICSKIDSVPGKTVVEADLKQLLGYQGSKGHRVFRRVKTALIKKGYIQEYLGNIGKRGRNGGPIVNKPVRCLRLVKAYTGDAEGEDDDDEDEDGDEDPFERVFYLTHGEQVAEAAINRQFFERMISAGDAGVASYELDGAFAMNMKRAAPKCKELKQRFGVSTRSCNLGRIISLKYTASHQLLNQYSNSVSPLPSPLDRGKKNSGFSGALRQAIAAGGDGQVVDNDDDNDGGELDEEMMQLLMQGGLDGKNLTAQEARNLLAQGGLEGGALGGAAAGGDVSTEGAQGYFYGPRRQATERGDRRLKWTMDRIDQDGFLLSMEMGKYLLDCEERDRKPGDPEAVQPDRKTCNRVVARAKVEGLIEAHDLNFPSAVGSLSNKAQIVLVRPGTVLDEAFINKVYEQYRAHGRKARPGRPSTGGGGGSGSGRRAVASLDSLPVLDNVPRLLLPPNTTPKNTNIFGGSCNINKGGGGGRREQQQQQQQQQQEQQPQEQQKGYSDIIGSLVKNGFSSYKMTRAKALHDVLVRLVLEKDATTSLVDSQYGGGGSGGSSGGQGPTSATATTATTNKQDGSVFLVSHIPPAVEADGSIKPGWESKANKSGPMKGLTLQTPQNKAILGVNLLTSQKVWNSFTVYEYLSIVGSSSSNHELITKLRENYATVIIEQMPEETKKELTSSLDNFNRDRPMGRLSVLFDMLVKLGAISVVVPVGENTTLSTSSSDSSYLFHRELYVQDVEDNDDLMVNNRLMMFNATDDQQREEFWNRLAWLLFAFGGLVPGRNKRALIIKNCYPYDAAPEALLERNWGIRAAIPLAIVAQVETAMPIGERKSFNVVCRAAKDLGLPFIQILLASSKIFTSSSTTKEGGGGRRRGGGGNNTDAGMEKGKVRKHRRHATGKRRLMDILDDEDEWEDEDEDEDEEEWEDGVGGEEVEGEEEEGAEASERQPRQKQPASQRPVLQRKKRWYQSEDRQLLRCWTAFIAASGPDMPMHWRTIPNKPQNIGESTLRHRLKKIRSGADTAPLCTRIVDLAAAVHERKVMREAFSSAMNLGDGDGDGDILDGLFLPPPPPPAESPPVDLVGCKRGPPDDDDDDNNNNAAKKKARGEHGQPIPPIPPPLLLFDAVDDADKEALSTLEQLIESIVALAPMQYAAPAPGILTTRQQQQQQQQQQSRKALTITVLRPWAGMVSQSISSGGSVHGAVVGGKAVPVSGLAAVAAEVVKFISFYGVTAINNNNSSSSSSSNDDDGTTNSVDNGVGRLLSSRFSDTDVSAALEWLVACGLLIPPSVRTHGLQPSDRFRSHVRPMKLSASLFESAARYAVYLTSQQTVTHVCTTTADSQHIVRLNNDADGELHGGAVATLLDNIAAGSMTLKIGSIKIGDVPLDQITNNKASLFPTMSVVVGTKGGSAKHYNNNNTPIKNDAKKVSNMIYFQPSLVAVSERIRSQAEAACFKAADACALAEVCLTLLRAMGDAGSTLQELGDSLESSPAILMEIQKSLDQLVVYGLVRRVASATGASEPVYGDDNHNYRFYCPEFSQNLLAFPHHAGSSKNNNDDEHAMMQLLNGSGTNLPPQGQLQPNKDVYYKCWTDHQGKVNTPLWQSLIQRATSIAMRHPGVSEDMLIIKMEVLAYDDAKTLLDTLCDGGVLSVRSVVEKKIVGDDDGGKKKRSSALMSCFSRSRKKHDDDDHNNNNNNNTGTEVEVHSRYYFIGPEWSHLDRITPLTGVC